MAEEYHESLPEISEEAKDFHRAIQSLVEELQAVDWYNQRVDVSRNEELKAVLAHNRDEEIEHASMILEWLRRETPKIDEQLREYLFTSGPITEIEAAGEGGESPSEAGHSQATSGDLGIGKLEKGA